MKISYLIFIERLSWFILTISVAFTSASLTLYFTDYNYENFEVQIGEQYSKEKVLLALSAVPENYLNSTRIVFGQTLHRDGINGQYISLGNVVSVQTNSSSDVVWVGTLFHELGHHYYYTQLSSYDHIVWEEQFLIDNHSVSEYGSIRANEDFAEMFECVHFRYCKQGAYLTTSMEKRILFEELVTLPDDYYGDIALRRILN